MFHQEFEELAHVAPIGFERFRRITALVAEMGEPVPDLGHDIVCKWREKPFKLNAGLYAGLCS
jgi:hypothetical protein